MSVESGGCQRCGSKKHASDCKAPFQRAWPGKRAMRLHVNTDDASMLIDMPLRADLADRAEALFHDACAQGPLIDGPPKPGILDRPGVGVAVLVRRAGDGALLMGRRQGSHGEGAWAFPGGHMEGDETPALAGARELGEEAGIFVEADTIRILPQYTFTMFPGKRSYVTIYGVVLVHKATPLPAPCREMSEWAWAQQGDRVLTWAPLQNLIAQGVNPWDL